MRSGKLIARLEDQRTLAKDPTFAPTVQRWVKQEDGTKQRVEMQKPLRPSWRTDVTGFHRKHAMRLLRGGQTNQQRAPGRVN